jgi:hypothetical protein
MVEHYECEGQLTITDFLKSKVVSGKVKDLTTWINSSGKAQYTQVRELVNKALEDYGIEATNEQVGRLTNAISVYILNQSSGYMEYLRGECQ